MLGNCNKIKMERSKVLYGGSIVYTKQCPVCTIYERTHFLFLFFFVVFLGLENPLYTTHVFVEEKCQEFSSK